MTEPLADGSEAGGRERSPLGYVQLLRQNADYRRLWSAEVVSFFGDFFNTIALFTAVEQLSGRTEAVASVFIAKMLPIFVMTPVAGPLIDRFDRRRLLIGTDIARALCAVGLIFAYWAQSMGWLIGLLVLMTCFAGIFMPAKSAVLPQIASARELGAANALSAGTWSVMLAVGAASGGLVTALVGIELALACDALTFVVSAAILVPLPPLLPTAASGGQTGANRRGFLAGLRYLRRRPYLTAVISIKSFMALAGGSLAMLPVFGTRVFPATSGPEYVGWLYASRGLGALVGSLLIRRLFGDSPRTMRRFITPALLFIAASHVALSQTRSIEQAALAYFAAAVGGGTLWVSSGTLGQLAAANEYRGRVFSVEWGLMTLVLSGVAALAGAAVDRAGWSVREVAMASGLVLIAPAGLWAGLQLVVRVGLARRGFRSDGSPDPRKERGDPPVLDPAWSRRWLGEPADGK